MRLLKSLAEIDCGEVDGMLMREVQARFPTLWQRNLAQAEEDFQWPGGESYRRLRRRVLRVIRLIAERHKGERVLLVTHAGFISSLLGFLAGTNPAEWSKFRPGNASITEVVWNGRGGDLIAFDDRSHLNSNGQ
jgi:alpha-ribazole phosphatase/probable phosphoglycerate mutase